MNALLRLSFRALVGCALLFALPACDSSSDDDDDGGGGSGGNRIGNATASISGGASGAIDGSAFASLYSDEFGSEIDLILLDGDFNFLQYAQSFQGDVMNINIEDVDPIGIGTYPIDADGNADAYADAFFLENFDAQNPSFVGYEAISGTVTLTAVNGNEVRGSFSVTMRPVPGGGEADVTATGSFTAAVVEDERGENIGGDDEGISYIEASAYAGTLLGNATYAAVDGAFVLTLHGEAEGITATVQFVRPSGGVPAVGTYSVLGREGTGGDFGGLFTAVGGETPATFEANFGELTITSVSGGEIVGNFFMNGASPSTEPYAPTTTGSFRAVSS